MRCRPPGVSVVVRVVREIRTADLSAHIRRRAAERGITLSELRVLADMASVDARVLIARSRVIDESELQRVLDALDLTWADLDAPPPAEPPPLRLLGRKLYQARERQRREYVTALARKKNLP